MEKIDYASLNAGRVLHPGSNSRYTWDSGAVDLIPKTMLTNEKNSKIEDTLSTKMNAKLSTKIDTKLGIRKINALIPTKWRSFLRAFLARTKHKKWLVDTGVTKHVTN